MASDPRTSWTDGIWSIADDKNNPIGSMRLRAVPGPAGLEATIPELRLAGEILGGDRFPATCTELEFTLLAAVARKGELQPRMNVRIVLEKDDPKAHTAKGFQQHATYDLPPDGKKHRIQASRVNRDDKAGTHPTEGAMVKSYGNRSSRKR